MSWAAKRKCVADEMVIHVMHDACHHDDIGRVGQQINEPLLPDSAAEYRRAVTVPGSDLLLGFLDVGRVGIESHVPGEVDEPREVRGATADVDHDARAIATDHVT